MDKRQKLIQGVGIFDIPRYTVYPTINGKRVICPIYDTWRKMLERAYCGKWKKRHPTYKTVTVAKEWLYFSNFRDWVLTQNYRNMSLDKDLRVLGNKHYSPKTCIFIPKELNVAIVHIGKLSNITERKGVKGSTFNAHSHRISVTRKTEKEVLEALINIKIQKIHALSELYIEHKDILLIYATLWEVGYK